MVRIDRDIIAHQQSSLRKVVDSNSQRIFELRSIFANSAKAITIGCGDNNIKHELSEQREAFHRRISRNSVEGLQKGKNESERTLERNAH